MAGEEREAGEGASEQSELERASNRFQASARAYEAVLLRLEAAKADLEDKRAQVVQIEAAIASLQRDLEGAHAEREAAREELQGLSKPGEPADRAGASDGGEHEGDEARAPDTLEGSTEMTPGNAPLVPSPLVVREDMPPPAPPEPTAPPGPAFRLRNGSEGQAYDEAPESEDGVYVIEAIEGLEGTGLRFEEGRLRGTLAFKGERTLLVKGVGPDEGQSFRSRTLLIANPDPRSLWTEREPTDRLYEKPHTDARSVSTESFRVFGASRRGRSHAHVGAYREDDFRIDSFGEWALIAVSDGAGSAKFSRLGSKVACERAVDAVRAALQAGRFDREVEPALQAYAEDKTPERLDRLKRALWEPLVHSLNKVVRTLEGLSKQEKLLLSDLASTLLFTMCRRYDFGWVFVGYGVGDGVTTIYRDQEDPALLVEPDGGEFAGQTRFITMKEVWADSHEMFRRTRIEISAEPARLVSMTDGVSDPMFDSENALRDRESWARFFGELEPVLESPEDAGPVEARLLDWLNFFRTGEHDDRTLVVLLPR